MKLGKILKEIRVKKFPDQKTFCELVGISQPHLSQIEGGTKKPAMETLERMATVLEIPIPIITWLGIERKDVPQRKRDAFDMLKPAMDALLAEFFPLDKS